jgi:hypothetical protein
MFGQFGQQFRHAAIWQAYTPVLAGIGMMAAKAMGQGDYISKPQYGLIGVGFDEKMRRQSAEWALGLQHPYVQPQQHLNTLKEVASALNVETTQGSLKEVQRSAELTSMAAQYAMTDTANVSRYTGRAKNLLLKDPRYKHMSSPEAYNYVMSSQAKIMQLGTAHLPEFYTASTYALQPMMQRGRTFEEASAEISYAVEQIGSKAGPGLQKVFTGQVAHGKIAKAAIMRDILDSNIGKFGLTPQAVHQTVLQTAEKEFGAKGKLRKQLEEKIRDINTQVKTQRGTIVTLANYKKDIDALARTGTLKGSRSNIVDESMIPLLSVYGQLNSSSDVDEMLKEIRSKQGSVDLPEKLRQGYVDQSFGSISGRFNKGMDVHYDSMRNEIGAPVYRWLNKTSNAAAIAPQYLHSVKSGNADEQARQIAVMRDLASRGEGREITPQMYRGAQMYNQEGSKVRSYWEEGSEAFLPTGGMWENYKKYGKPVEVGWKSKAVGIGAGALLAGGFLMSPFTAGMSIPAALGLAGLAGGVGYGGWTGASALLQTGMGLYGANAPTLENFERRSAYEDTEKFKQSKWTDASWAENKKRADKFGWTKPTVSDLLPFADQPLVGEGGEGPGFPKPAPALSKPSVAGGPPSEDQIFGYTKELAAGGINPTVIVPAPVVQVFVQTTAGGGVNISSQTSGSAVNQPVQQGPSGIPESGPMSSFYNTPSGNLSGTQLHAPR